MIEFKRAIRRSRAVVMGIAAVSLVWATPGAAIAQDFTPTNYVSVLSGLEIEVAGPSFAITSVDHEDYHNGEGEIISIDSDLANAEVSFFDDTDTPTDSIDAYLRGVITNTEEFTVVDRGEDGDTTWALATMTYEDLGFTYYLQVTKDITGNVDLFQAHLSVTDSFVYELEAAQREITIDGDAFLANVDAEDLMAMATGDAPATPEADLDTEGTPASSDASDPRANARIGDATAEPTEVSTEVATEVATEAPTEVPVAAGIFEGGNFGHTVTFDESTWQASPGVDQETDSDRLALSSLGGEATQYVVVIVGESQDITPAAWLTEWQSDAYLTDALFGGEEGEASVLTTRQRDDSAGVVIRYIADGESYIMVRQVFVLEDGTTLLLVVDVAEADAAEAYSAVYDGIQFDGDTLPQLLTTRQVQRAIGE